MRGRAGFVHAHRRKSPRVFAAVIALAVATLAGCTRAPVPPYQQQILAFGTLVDITIADTEPSAAQAARAGGGARRARGGAGARAPGRGEAGRGARRRARGGGAGGGPASGRRSGAG